MFLFWLLITLIIGAGENVKDSYDARKYHRENPNLFNGDKWWK